MVDIKETSENGMEHEMDQTGSLAMPLSCLRLLSTELTLLILTLAENYTRSLVQHIYTISL